MKKLFRSYVINLVAILATTHILPALTIDGSAKGLLISAFVFMVANGLLTLVFKIILLPLNLLTLGLFAWVGNILALYALVSYLPLFTVSPYDFPGFTTSAFNIPPYHLSTFGVAIVASLILAFIIHFLHWFID